MDNWLVTNDIHAVDVVRYLAGADVAEVHSFARRAFSEYRDLHAALVIFENDCVANYAFNYTTGYRLERYEIHGRDISVFLEGVDQGSVNCDGKISQLPPADTGGTEEELRYFVDCVLDDRPVQLPAANLDEAVKSVELVGAIRAGFRETERSG
jgi:predicted dehydrogenase